MEVFVKIERGRYVDSLETLLASGVLNEQAGIEIGCAGMATDPGKDVLEAATSSPPGRSPGRLSTKPWLR